ncbi:DUF1652 domain-containing protein [Pseudomonas sp. CFBP 8770]|jgi:hypothetical protein|uniref:DUF1652 domain-containing protein n=1 Tax=unclassified Pseudomonas TaxID=196821 RepID=UPI000F05B4F8|nr:MULTISPECIES: DUF1652 domain-containing protein [unclassified Pseudomonas]MBD8472630.1 DUF1652 domain-containing protein [Pseudomonas sp. CFBP 8773]MBD8646268.1 DUF1652 domain-containing protein [Pseudomonas sp. CFBP 8770]
MIPTTEMRRIVEASFAPLKCHCTLNPGGTMTVEVSDPASGQVDLLMVGVDTQPLSSSRAIAELVAQLRAELKGNQEWFCRHAPRGATRS